MYHKFYRIYTNINGIRKFIETYDYYCNAKNKQKELILIHGKNNVSMERYILDYKTIS